MNKFSDKRAAEALRRLGEAANKSAIGMIAFTTLANKGIPVKPKVAIHKGGTYDE